MFSAIVPELFPEVVAVLHRPRIILCNKHIVTNKDNAIAH